MFKIFSKKKKPNKYLTAIVVGTAVVLFWRGMWGFLDHLLFPNSPLLSYGISLFIGLGVLYKTHTLIKELE